MAPRRQRESQRSHLHACNTHPDANTRCLPPETQTSTPDQIDLARPPIGGQTTGPKGKKPCDARVTRRFRSGSRKRSSRRSTPPPTLNATTAIAARDAEHARRSSAEHQRLLQPQSALMNPTPRRWSRRKNRSPRQTLFSSRDATFGVGVAGIASFNNH